MLALAQQAKEDALKDWYAALRWQTGRYIGQKPCDRLVFIDALRRCTEQNQALYRLTED